MKLLMKVALCCWLFSQGISAVAQQAKQDKPLLFIRVDSDIGTRAAGVSSLNSQELRQLREQLVEHLSSMYQIIPKLDPRDCVEVGIVAEKLAYAHGYVYVASSAISIGKDKDDLLVTHNAVVQPTLELVEMPSFISFL